MMVAAHAWSTEQRILGIVSRKFSHARNIISSADSDSSTFVITAIFINNIFAFSLVPPGIGLIIRCIYVLPRSARIDANCELC